MDTTPPPASHSEIQELLSHYSKEELAAVYSTSKGEWRQLAREMLISKLQDAEVLPDWSKCETIEPRHVKMLYEDFSNYFKRTPDEKDDSTEMLLWMIEHNLLTDERKKAILIATIIKSRSDIQLLMLNNNVWTLKDVRVDNNSLLLYACRCGHVNVIQKLLDLGLTPTDLRTNNNAPLNFACRSGQIKAVHLLMTHGLNKVDIYTNNYAALYSATLWGHEHIVQLLLSYGLTRVDMCMRDNRLLHDACRFGHVKTVEMLLSGVQGPGSGLIMDDVRSDNNMALRNACRVHINIKDDPKLVWMFGKKITETISMHQDKTMQSESQSLDKNFKIVQMLVNYGLTLEDFRANHNEPLRNACLSGNKNVVELLLKQGLLLSDICVSSNMVLYNAPLFNACKGGHLEIVKILVQHGLVSRDLWFGRSKPLCAACKNGHANIVRFLLAEKTLAADHIEKDKFNIIRAVCLGGSIEIIQMLIDFKNASGDKVFNLRTCDLRAALAPVKITNNHHMKKYEAAVKYIMEQFDMPSDSISIY